MADDFDPYYQWLAIPPKHQPPSHRVRTICPEAAMRTKLAGTTSTWKKKE